MNTCDIICILDRSGSMQSVKSDAIGGFNNLLKEQKALPGQAAMTVVLFDHEYEVLHSRKPIANVAPLNDASYVPRGTTALLDAIGKTLTTAKTYDAASPDHKFIVAIITDGQENASREWMKPAVKSLTDELTAKGWTFVYLAANQDAFMEAGALGMANQFTANYAATSIGTQSAYAGVSGSMTNIRSGNVTANAQKQK